MRIANTILGYMLSPRSRGNNISSFVFCFSLSRCQIIQKIEKNLQWLMTRSHNNDLSSMFWHFDSLQGNLWSCNHWIRLYSVTKLDFHFLYLKSHYNAEIRQKCDFSWLNIMIDVKSVLACQVFLYCRILAVAAFIRIPLRSKKWNVILK
jgi:hypothetical protein